MEIKKEKRNGLMYAKYNGELISAEIAEAKKEYKCPCCNALMHLTHTSKNEAYFALNPRTVHNTIYCRKMESGETTERVLDIPPEKLIGELIKISTRRVGREAGTAGPDAISPKPNITEKDITQLGFKSLKQMYDNGLYYFGKAI